MSIQYPVTIIKPGKITETIGVKELRDIHWARFADGEISRTPVNAKKHGVVKMNSLFKSRRRKTNGEPERWNPESFDNAMPGSTYKKNRNSSVNYTPRFTTGGADCE